MPPGLRQAGDEPPMPSSSSLSPPAPPSAVDVAVDRSLRDRRAVAAGEVARLIDAALQLIRETGDLEPKVSEIVRVSGLHNQAFYRHFRSKRELLVAVLDHGIALLAGYVAHRMDAADGPEGRVRAWLAGVLEQARHPAGAEATRPFALARGRLADAFPEEVRESERRLTALVRDAIAEGREAGAFPHADPERDAEMLHLLAMGFVERRLAAPGHPSEEDARALEAFGMAGLARGAAIPDHKEAP